MEEVTGFGEEAAAEVNARSWEPEGLALGQPGLPNHLPHLPGRDNCTHPSL